MQLCSNSNSITTMLAFRAIFVYYLHFLRTTNAESLVCPENEVLVKCKNPCEPSCQEPNPPVCYTFACQPGCVCKPGTTRDENSGKCVSLDYCSEVCPKNEMPSNCTNQCELTCQNPNFECIVQSKRCICKSGLVRDLYSGKCVSPKYCPKEKCGVNEEWNLCTSPKCRRTCQNRFFKELFVCTMLCTPGCACIEGYIWDEYRKKCVRECECPEACSLNEEWKECSNIACRATCQNLDRPTFCRAICQPGCACKDGFIWDEQQKQCVCKENCSQPCGENEIWKDCSDIHCRETCQKLKPVVCTKMCQQGCCCKDGYIWDEYLNKCVRRWECSKVCGENQEWCEFVPGDTPTCQSLLRSKCDYNVGLSITSLRPGCICRQGFIRNEITEECVLLEECPGFDSESILPLEVTSVPTTESSTSTPITPTGTTSEPTGTPTS